MWTAGTKSDADAVAAEGCRCGRSDCRDPRRALHPPASRPHRLEPLHEELHAVRACKDEPAIGREPLDGRVQLARVVSRALIRIIGTARGTAPAAASFRHRSSACSRARVTRTRSPCRERRSGGCGATAPARGGDQVGRAFAQRPVGELRDQRRVVHRLRPPRPPTGCRRARTPCHAGASRGPRIRANAPTGAEQPPPSARRKPRSASVSACRAGSSIAARTARVAWSAVRHCTAMAPCPGAGRMSVDLQPLGRSSRPARAEARPRRQGASHRIRRTPLS